MSKQSFISSLRCYLDEFFGLFNLRNRLLIEMTKFRGQISDQRAEGSESLRIIEMFVEHQIRSMDLFLNDRVEGGSRSETNVYLKFSSQLLMFEIQLVQGAMIFGRCFRLIFCFGDQLFDRLSNRFQIVENCLRKTQVEDQGGR